MTITHQISLEIESNIAKLRELAQAFSNGIGPYVTPIEPDTILTELVHINDFQDLERVPNQLQAALGQIVINQRIGGRVRIINIENGSQIYEVFLGTAVAVQLVLMRHHLN